MWKFYELGKDFETLTIMATWLVVQQVETADDCCRRYLNILSFSGKLLDTLFLGKPLVEDVLGSLKAEDRLLKRVSKKFCSKRTF